MNSDDKYIANFIFVPLDDEEMKKHPKYKKAKQISDMEQRIYLPTIIEKELELLND